MASTKKPAKPAASGLMGLAKKTVKATAKKDDKEVITVSDQTVSDAIDNYIKNKKIADEAAAAMAASSEIVKSEGGKKIFIEEMEKTGRSKESFILASKNGNSLMYVVTDAYKRANLDEERVEYLRGKFGDEIITDKNEFIVNPELIDEHGETLCELIKNCPKFSEEVKESLIQLKQTFTIAKGTKDKMRDIAKASKTTVEIVFEEVQPTCQVKVRGAK